MATLQKTRNSTSTKGRISPKQDKKDKKDKQDNQDKQDKQDKQDIQGKSKQSKFKSKISYTNYRSRSHSPPQISPVLKPHFTSSLPIQTNTIIKPIYKKKNSENITHIQPVLSNDELENNKDITITNVNETQEVCVLATPDSSGRYSPLDTPIFIPTYIETITKEKEIKENENKKDIQSQITYDSFSDFYNNKYTNKLYIIKIIKHLVFQYDSLILGSFNSLELSINKVTKEFNDYIKQYEKTNNVKLSDNNIYKLFLDDTIFPKTNKRLILQNSMDIIIHKHNIIEFIEGLKYYFTNSDNNNNYSISYLKKGKINEINKNNIVVCKYTNIDIYVYTITDLINNFIFKINFIIIENKLKINKTIELPLVIPYGLYNSEHLYITNDGNDKFEMAYGNSSCSYICDNIDNNIVAIMPKYNDVNYNNLCSYIINMMKLLPENNLYIFEVDLLINSHIILQNFENYNNINQKSLIHNIHKKSEFWISNRILSKDVLCVMCDSNISKNSNYVIAKCCDKIYHIECMELNYIPTIHNVSSNYNFICDCGFITIDYNNCNSTFLHNFYIN